MTGERLVESFAGAVRSVGLARQAHGKGHDMLDPEAAEDLARNLAQGLVGVPEESADLLTALVELVAMVKRNGGYMSSADQATLLAAERVVGREP